MTETSARDRATFSSPAMRARVHLLAVLRAVDDLERAWASRDYWTARALAAKARETLDEARIAWEEAEGHTNVLDSVEPGSCLCDGPWSDLEPAARPGPESREHLTTRPGCKWASDLEPLGPELSQADMRGQWGDR